MRAGALTLVVLLTAAGAVFADANPGFSTTPVVLKPADVPWRRLELTASRFPFTATSEVELTLVDTGDVQLRATGEGQPVAPGPVLVKLGYHAEFFGQKFQTSLWMQADSGAALQYETVESGRRKRNRVLRFTDRGVALWTVRPADGEEDKPAAAWSDRSTGFRPYGTAPDGPVLDPLGLLYVVAAAGLGTERAQVELLGLAGRQLVGLTLLARPVVVVPVDYSLRQGTARRRCRGKVRAVPVDVRPQSLTGDENQFDFLGLSSDIEVLVEEKTHLPIRISGRAHRLGNVTIKLRSAVLLEGAACG